MSSTFITEIRDDTALTPLVTQFQNIILVGRVHLAEHQGKTPTPDGVARRIGAGATLSLLIPWNAGGFVEADIRAFSVKDFLGSGDAEPECGYTFAVFCDNLS